MMPVPKAYRYGALIAFSLLLQCRDQLTESNAVTEPVRHQESSSTTPDGAMRIKGKNQGFAKEASIPCRLETQGSNRAGSKTKSEPAQTNTVELGVETTPGDSDPQWTPYLQHRCQ